MNTGDRVFETHDWYRVCGIQQCNVSTALLEKHKLYYEIIRQNVMHVSLDY